MSLDVYLELRGHIQQVPDPEPRIFMREDGQTKQISRAEWDARNPGREPVTVPAAVYEHDTTVYRANITHNLNVMADAAGLYIFLWRPDEHHIQTAQQLIAPLREGLARLQATPGLYKIFNPDNGWGTYEGLVSFVREYLAACEHYPAATVRVSR